MAKQIPPEEDVIDFIRVAHYRAFKKDIENRSSKPLAIELMVKGSKAPQYIHDFVKHAVKAVTDAGNKPYPTLAWFVEVCKRK